MRNIKKGVMEGSEIYFHTPSGLEKSMFLYPLSVGHFYCNHRYETSRIGLDNYLIIYIKNGKGLLIYEGKTTYVKKGEIIFINCNRPHTYKSDPDWESVWMHFNGTGAKQYYDIIEEKMGNVSYVGEGMIYQVLMSILKTFRDNEPMNEAIMSCYIQRILAELYQNTCNAKRNSGILFDVLQYIQENYNKNISLDDLCNLVHLSPYYFCRMFKKEMGYAPYEYIIVVRINMAKRLLKKTNKTIKEIAFETGFNSEANFIRTFKVYTNMTPGIFKKTDF
ncbi:MAG: AraC family transcriptional regulator [Clostridia bacterium]|nr:AraC family transcriptional regulator [Clostridia bacterium]